MPPPGRNRTRALALWSLLALILAAPLIAAAQSPLLAWREPVYIVAGFAGVIGLALMLLQPLLAAGYLPGIPASRGRRLHRWIGVSLVLAVVVHVGGLWITSPPDVIDALTLTSPTPFSAWGVLAMWALVATALLASLRRRLRLPPRLWRRAHTALAVLIVSATAIHALLIEGTMEPITKAALCLAALLVTLKVIADLRIWARPRRRDA